MFLSKAAQATFKCPSQRAQPRDRLAQLLPRAGGASPLHHVLLLLLLLQPVAGPTFHFFFCCFSFFLKIYLFI